jgi:hypothetical protein
MAKVDRIERSSSVIQRLPRRPVLAQPETWANSPSVPFWRGISADLEAVLAERRCWVTGTSRGGVSGRVFGLGIAAAIPAGAGDVGGRIAPAGPERIGLDVLAVHCPIGGRHPAERPFHTLLREGVFARDADGTMRCRPVPPRPLATVPVALPGVYPKDATGVRP